MSSGTTMAVAARPPVSLTSLVGREREMSELRALISAKRLVTITGVGGSGKTRLASELALRIDWERRESVAWVELGACGDPMGVPQRTAAALSLRAAADGETLDAIAGALRDREFLLVLDNCEHLVAASADLASQLLTRCPQLHILATSAEPLGVAGEHVWPVPPISAGEARQLFSERATAVDASFTLTDENKPAVDEICRRLDGIPLAIELAAARTRVLTPAQIAAKLEDRFAILTGGARTAVARHRTLRAAIDWSFALLSEREQVLLARLSVFAGTFSLEMAEEVCDATLDLLTGIVDKSLVVTSRRGHSVRYHLLETIRQYAAERLAATGEREEIQRRHAMAYLAMAHAVVVDPMDAITARLEALDTEHDNVRAALSWSIEHAPDTIALPLGAEFRWYWYYRILWSEGLRWLSRVLERSSTSLTRERAAVLSGAGVLSAYLGELAAGRQWLEEAERMWRSLGDQRELALTLSALAQLLANAGELDAASERAAESVKMARAHGTSWDIAYCLTNGLAFVAQQRGALDEADAALEEAEAIWSPGRHPLGLPFVLSARALLAVRRGDHCAADHLARAALTEARAVRELWFSARAMRVLALTSTGDPARAARLLGAADAMLRAIGARVVLHEKNECDRLVTQLRAAMSREGLDAAMAEGGAMSFDEACDFALAAPAAADSAVLQVNDLGPLQITMAGKRVGNDGRASNRARELLVFLLAHAPGPTKDEVGVAFWPDATAEQVKNSFHVTLHRLRKLLGGPDAVVADGARYRVKLPHVLLSRRFESEMTTALRNSASDTEALSSALALYAGDFLQSEDAGEWCLPIRTRLRLLFVRGLFALGQAQESRQRYADAAETYARVLGRDPFHEAAARHLMICRARLGARSESLLVYRELEARLRDDLQALPEPETSSLYTRLRQNESI